jgi:hypothetical protein
MPKINEVFDRNPIFQVGQLRALVTPDIFEVIDWLKIFHTRYTSVRGLVSLEEPPLLFVRGFYRSRCHRRIWGYGVVRRLSRS